MVHLQGKPIREPVMTKPGKELPNKIVPSGLDGLGFHASTIAVYGLHHELHFWRFMKNHKQSTWENDLLWDNPEQIMLQHVETCVARFMAIAFAAWC